MTKEQSTLQKFVANHPEVKKSWIAKELGFTREYLSLILRQTNDDNFKVGFVKKINELDERLSKL